MKRIVFLIMTLCAAVIAKAQTDVDTTCVDVRSFENAEDSELPKYKSGIPSVFQYIGNNLKYPREAVKNGVEGRVITMFVVETDGSVSHVTPVQSLVHFNNKQKLIEKSGMSEQELTNLYGNMFQDEAKRVISSMPKWKPGHQHGKPVRVKFSLPISFRR